MRQLARIKLQSQEQGNSSMTLMQNPTCMVMLNKRIACWDNLPDEQQAITYMITLVYEHDGQQHQFKVDNTLTHSTDGNHLSN
jgi:hypothetical protein